VRSTGPAVAVIDQLKAADKARFGARIGKLADQEMFDIGDAVAFLLDLL
jgi:mRNA-degrading endonuclease toxin of MazEF toxin-antitoxin module